jgi:NADPH:quinone reductase-like Zn-dependent oxidoreductase
VVAEPIWEYQQRLAFREWCISPGQQQSVRDILQMLWTSLVGNKKVICAFASESAESLVAARELAEVGELKAVIDRVYPLEQAAEAHRYYESGQKRGEIVLTLMDNGNA